MTTQILALSGSLRVNSYNTALLRAAERAAADAAHFEYANIGSLPHYQSELDGDDKPSAVRTLIDQIQAADGLLIASPEYNYSVPGVLKNAIDWASRPAYRSALAHKPTAIMGASRSGVGTARAQSHLRQILGGTLTPLFPHPDVLVGGAHTKFDESLQLTDEATFEHLAGFVKAFVAWTVGQGGAA
jgi:chromate reductase